MICNMSHLQVLTQVQGFITLIDKICFWFVTRVWLNFRVLLHLVIENKTCIWFVTWVIFRFWLKFRILLHLRKESIYICNMSHWVISEDIIIWVLTRVTSQPQGLVSIYLLPLHLRPTLGKIFRMLCVFPFLSLLSISSQPGILSSLVNLSLVSDLSNLSWSCLVPT